MATVYEVPLTATPQSFAITLGSTQYRLRLAFLDAIEAGWAIDLSDVDGNSIVAGVPLVTGRNLLEPYDYLGIGGELWVATDADPDAVPTFDNLGSASHLYFRVP